MFFDNTDEIIKIAQKSGCAVFVMPRQVDFNIKNALILKPEEKTTITIDQIRNLIGQVAMRQLEERYIIVRPADLLNEIAANALLKSLEEPKEKIHYILITDTPSKLLPTILSRSAIYFLRTSPRLNEKILVDEKTMDLAKKLMTARKNELVDIAEQITKGDGARTYALEVVGTTIEILYKSYFLTEKEIFLKKLPKFLKLYENLEKNGHLKLHLVADLI